MRCCRVFVFSPATGGAPTRARQASAKSLSRHSAWKRTCSAITPYTIVSSHTRTDVSLTYRVREDAWSLAEYVNNIENDDVPTLTSQSLDGVGFVFADLQLPRTYGLRLTAHF